MHTSIPILVASLALSPAAFAAQPSFTCTSQAKEVEKLICTDAELAAMDVTMARLYKRVLKNTPKADQQDLKAEQRGWLEGRNACWKAANHKACVKADYEARIQELKDK
jgi:uncharacterized protein